MKTLMSLIAISLFVPWIAMADARWDQLTAKVTTEGARLDTQFGMYVSLSSVVPLDDKGSHQADYISGVGGVDEDDVFHAGRFELVSETWIKDANGNWDVDQWLFRVSVEGVLQWGGRYRLVETERGTVISHDSIPLKEGELDQALLRQLQNWYQRTHAQP